MEGGYPDGFTRGRGPGHRAFYSTRQAIAWYGFAKKLC